MPLTQRSPIKNPPEDIKKMQQDAVKRVLEMQKKAQKSLEDTKFQKEVQTVQNDHPNNGVDEKVSSECLEGQSIKSPPKKEKDLPKKLGNNPLGGIPNLAETLFKDKEKVLILTLILILMSEKDENNLEIILALVYILYF